MYALLLCSLPAWAADVAPAGSADPKVTVEPKLAVTGSSKDEDTLTAAASFRWVGVATPEGLEHPDTTFVERALTISAAAATAKGEATLVPTSLPDATEFGVSFSVLRKRGSLLPGPEEFAVAAHYQTWAVARCTAECARPERSATAVAWCEKHKPELALGELADSLDVCPSAAPEKSELGTSTLLPNFTAYSLGADLRVSEHEWLDGDAGGTLTEAEARKYGWGAWGSVSSVLKPDGAPTRWTTLEAAASFETAYDDASDTGEWCEAAGTVGDDAAAVTTCHEAPVGAPSLSRTLGGELFIGTIAPSLAHWRVSAGPVWSTTFTDDGSESSVGVKIPFYADLSGKEYTGTFKGVMRVAPSVTYNLADGGVTPAVTISLLSQKYLLDPTIRP